MTAITCPRSIECCDRGDRGARGVPPSLHAEPNRRKTIAWAPASTGSIPRARAQGTNVCQHRQVTPDRSRRSHLTGRTPRQYLKRADPAATVTDLWCCLGGELRGVSFMATARATNTRRQVERLSVGEMG